MTPKGCGSVLCARCKIEMVRIEFPVTHRLSASGRSLAAWVDRCPSCGLEWQEMPSRPPVVPRLNPSNDRVIESVPEQLSMFDVTIGGFR
ncbi:hypothetical protein D3C78_1707320 [compost metagenome]